MNESIKLEENLARIEEIVEILEKGEKPINEMVNLYEEAVGLSIKCRDFLEKTENKIIEINNLTAKED